MMDFLASSIAFVVLLTLGFAVGWWTNRRANRKSKVAPSAPLPPTTYSQLLELREVGELSVFKAVSKDILTHSDHTFGDFGRRYLSWAFTKKRLAMIFEFEMDFRYDLRDPRCRIETMPDGTAQITLPPCNVDVSIRDLSFYDEQRARLLPWLLPDLVQGFFEGRFSEDDKNRLIAGAREHAMGQAAVLAERYRPAFEGSARRTLGHMSMALGQGQATLKFSESERVVIGGARVDLPSSAMPPAPGSVQ
jgi:Protein of unknown function (DUF4230)